MAQQINLCMPILLTEKRYFSAKAMVQSLVVILVVICGLCAAWVWSLESAGSGFSGTMAIRAAEIDSLQTAIERSRANAAPVDGSLIQQIQDKHNAFIVRKKMLSDLRLGQLVPGFAHSDRLRWVAISIPESVWVTYVKMQEGRLEATGFTLEPSALNDWVAKLSSSPLMHSLRLADVKVENTRNNVPPSDKPVAVGPPTWAFSLVSAEPTPPALSAPLAVSQPAGSKP